MTEVSSGMQYAFFVVRQALRDEVTFPDGTVSWRPKGTAKRGCDNGGRTTLQHRNAQNLRRSRGPGNRDAISSSQGRLWNTPRSYAMLVVFANGT